MKRIILSAAILILIISQANGQIEDEIKSYVDSTELLVQNGRKMIFSELIDSNYFKVREIYNYLSDETEGEHYAAFFYTEDLYINMLTSNWETVDLLMRDMEDYRQKVTYSNSKELTYKLYELIKSGSDQVLFSCQNSMINEEAKKIVKLMILYVEPDADPNEFNSELKQYKKEYKESEYEKFVEDFMPGKIIKASYSYALGSGMVIPTRNLGEVYSSSAAYNMAMDINIDKVFTSFYLNGSGPKLKEPFQVASETDTMSFEVGESFTYFDAGLKAGYFLVRNKRIHIAPFASISGSSISSTRYDDPDDNDLEYKPFNSFTYGAGLHTEIKIYEFDNPYQNYYGYSTSGYCSLKIEAGYNRIVKYNDPYVKGDVTYFIGALVIGFGSF